MCVYVVFVRACARRSVMGRWMLYNVMRVFVCKGLGLGGSPPFIALRGM